MIKITVLEAERLRETRIQIDVSTDVLHDVLSKNQMEMLHIAAQTGSISLLDVGKILYMVCERLDKGA